MAGPRRLQHQCSATTALLLACILGCACQGTIAWTLRTAVISADTAKRSLGFEQDGEATCSNAACVFFSWTEQQIHVSAAKLTTTNGRTRASCSLPTSLEDTMKVQLRCGDELQGSKQQLHTYGRLQLAGLLRGARCDDSFCNVFVELGIDLPQEVLRKATWRVTCKEDEWVQLEVLQQATTSTGLSVVLLEFGAAASLTDGCSLAMDRAIMQPLPLPNQDLSKLPTLGKRARFTPKATLVAPSTTPAQPAVVTTRRAQEVPPSTNATLEFSGEASTGFQDTYIMGTALLNGALRNCNISLDLSYVNIADGNDTIDFALERMSSALTNELGDFNVSNLASNPKAVLRVAPAHLPTDMTTDNYVLQGESTCYDATSARRLDFWLAAPLSYQNAAVSPLTTVIAEMMSIGTTTEAEARQYAKNVFGVQDPYAAYGFASFGLPLDDGQLQLARANARLQAIIKPMAAFLAGEVVTGQARIKASAWVINTLASMVVESQSTPPPPPSPPRNDTSPPNPPPETSEEFSTDFTSNQSSFTTPVMVFGTLPSRLLATTINTTTPSLVDELNFVNNGTQTGTTMDVYWRILSETQLSMAGFSSDALGTASDNSDMASALITAVTNMQNVIMNLTAQTSLAQAVDIATTRLTALTTQMALGNLTVKAFLSYTTYTSLMQASMATPVPGQLGPNPCAAEAKVPVWSAGCVLPDPLTCTALEGLAYPTVSCAAPPAWNQDNGILTFKHTWNESALSFTGTHFTLYKWQTSGTLRAGWWRISMPVPDNTTARLELALGSDTNTNLKQVLYQSTDAIRLDQPVNYLTWSLEVAAIRSAGNASVTFTYLGSVMPTNPRTPCPSQYTPYVISACQKPDNCPDATFNWCTTTPTVTNRTVAFYKMFPDKWDLPRPLFTAPVIYVSLNAVPLPSGSMTQGLYLLDLPSNTSAGVQLSMTTQFGGLMIFNLSTVNINVPAEGLSTLSVMWTVKPSSPAPAGSFKLSFAKDVPAPIPPPTAQQVSVKKNITLAMPVSAAVLQDAVMLSKLEDTLIESFATFFKVDPRYVTIIAIRFVESEAVRRSGRRLHGSTVSMIVDMQVNKVMQQDDTTTMASLDTQINTFVSNPGAVFATLSSDTLSSFGIDPAAVTQTGLELTSPPPVSPEPSPYPNPCSGSDVPVWSAGCVMSDLLSCTALDSPSAPAAICAAAPVWNQDSGSLTFTHTWNESAAEFLGSNYTLFKWQTNGTLRAGWWSISMSYPDKTAARLELGLSSGTLEVPTQGTDAIKLDQPINYLTWSLEVAAARPAGTASINLTYLGAIMPSKPVTQCTSENTPYVISTCQVPDDCLDETFNLCIPTPAVVSNTLAFTQAFPDKWDLPRPLYAAPVTYVSLFIPLSDLRLPKGLYLLDLPSNTSAGVQLNMTTQFGGLMSFNRSTANIKMPAEGWSTLHVMWTVRPSSPPSAAYFKLSFAKDVPAPIPALTAEQVNVQRNFTLMMPVTAAVLQDVQLQSDLADVIISQFATFFSVDTQYVTMLTMNFVGVSAVRRLGRRLHDGSVNMAADMQVNKVLQQNDTAGLGAYNQQLDAFVNNPGSVFSGLPSGTLTKFGIDPTTVTQAGLDLTSPPSPSPTPSPEAPPAGSDDDGINIARIVAPSVILPVVAITLALAAAVYFLWYKPKKEFTTRAANAQADNYAELPLGA